MTRPVKIISRLLGKAVKKRERKKAWDMWLTKYPNMSKDNFIEFEDFYKKLTTPIVVNESVETVQDTFNRFKQMVKGE